MSSSRCIIAGDLYCRVSIQKMEESYQVNRAKPLTNGESNSYTVHLKIHYRGIYGRLLSNHFAKGNCTNTKINDLCSKLMISGESGHFKRCYLKKIND
jgi:hypothetical protein